MISTKYIGLASGDTNLGMVRTNNEDTYICQLIWDENHILCAAIDGLGGYEGGEVAADIARQKIIECLGTTVSKKINDLLRNAVIEANNEIVRQHKERPKIAQMGCVASIGLIDLKQGIIYIAHVGDSRIYQFTDGQLKKLTHDHSLVGYREEIGEMTEEAAMSHPKRNVVDRFLGEGPLSGNAENYIEISAFPIVGNTQFLFCSDGLTDLVKSSQISEVLLKQLPVADKVRLLIDKANAAGGKDNITVVIANVSENAAPVTPEKSKENDTIKKTDKNTKEPKKNKATKTSYHLSAVLIPIITTVIGFALGYCAVSFFDKKPSNEIPNLQFENNDLKTQIDTLNSHIDNQATTITELNVIVDSLSTEKRDLEDTIEELNKTIKKLNKKILPPQKQKTHSETSGTTATSPEAPTSNAN